MPQHKEARIPTRQRAPRRQSITQTAIGMIRKKPVPGSKKKTKRNKAKVIQVHAIACPPSVKVCDSAYFRFERRAALTIVFMFHRAMKSARMT